MKLKDIAVSAIMLAALAGMGVMLFNIPVGIDTKTFGAWTFGAILIFGVINIALVIADGIRGRNDSK
ncbi:MAG: hypothetical protein ABJL55_12255 [Roseibium sp.]